MSPTPELVALGGNSAEFPEQTLPALRSALELGAAALCIDVQCSADGVPMLWNPAALASGRSAPAELPTIEQTAAMLARIEVADRERFGDRYAGTRVPALGDIGALLAQYPEPRLYARLGAATLARRPLDVTVGAICEALGPQAGRLVLVVTELGAIEPLRQLGIGTVGWVLPAWDTHTQIKCEAICPDLLVVDRGRIGHDGSLWRGPWRWLVTEVGSPGDAVALGRRGAHAIGTRQVRAMLRELRALLRPS
jgi:hypothetical protein